ncbi:MAG: phage tail protein, partial [Pseudodesulfovibrio sp.]|nr:phage tail protein [Pseudodesulfovibrio sp.]
MSSAITNAGEALIALHQNQETPLVIDKFIIANVAGVDPAAAVDRAGAKPAAGDIVYEYTIPAEGKGYINPNQVVYSMLLGSDIGDFDFNWLGLYSSADDTVVAITYCPTLSKWKTAHPTMGNAITRNFMLEYSGLQATTEITVEAGTWQIDFTARLKGIDERERLSNRDIYGEACFFGDGYLVVNDDGTFKLQPGTGYVEGIRIDQAAEQIIAPALPAEVFLDVALQPQGSDRIAMALIVFADPGDYADGTNDNHYGQKIAAIDAGGVVTDFRTILNNGSILTALDDKSNTNHKHVTEDVSDLLPDPHEWSEGQRYASHTLT